MNACGYTLLEITINYQISSSNHIRYGLIRNGPPEGGTYGPVGKVFSLQTWGSEFIFPKTPKQQDAVAHFCNSSVPIDKRASDTGDLRSMWIASPGTWSRKKPRELFLTRWKMNLTSEFLIWLSHSLLDSLTQIWQHTYTLCIYTKNYKYIPALASLLFYWLIVFKKYHVTPKLSFYVERHKRYECVYFIHIYEWNTLFHIYVYLYIYEISDYAIFFRIIEQFLSVFGFKFLYLLLGKISLLYTSKGQCKVNEYN